MKKEFKIFLQSSRFFGIEEYSTQSDLLDIFGEPNAIMGKEAKNAVILRFGNIEFHFTENTLFMIFSDTFDTPTLVENMAEEITHGMKRENFEEVLNKNGVSYKIKDREFDKRYKVIETEGKVEFYFLVEEPDEFVAEVKGLNYFKSDV